MNWKTLVNGLIILWNVSLTVLEAIVEVDRNSSRKKSGRYSSLVARDLYESGEISQSEFLKAFKGD